MSTYWIVQIVYSGIVIAFGSFLMWRSRVWVQKRMALLSTVPDNPPVLNDKQRRLEALKAEMSQLERELANVDNSHSIATGA